MAKGAGKSSKSSKTITVLSIVALYFALFIFQHISYISEALHFLGIFIAIIKARITITNNKHDKEKLQFAH